MDALRAALTDYEPLDAREARDVERLRDLVDQRDPWSRLGALHVTASALIVDPASRRVVLRWHARLQRWLQVGGHADPGETDPWAIAVREAREETGLDDLVPFTPVWARRPVQVVIVPVPADGDEPAHEHADIRYVLATARPEQLQAESEDTAVRWLGFDAARAEITEANLLELLDRVERLVDAVLS